MLTKKEISFSANDSKQTASSAQLTFFKNVKIRFTMFENAINHKQLSVLQTFLKHPQKEIINPEDDNNILHLAFELGDASVVNIILDSLEPKTLRDLLCRINKNKYLPSDCLTKNKHLSKPELTIIIQKIIASKPYPQFKKLGEGVDEKEILKELNQFPRIHEIIKAMNVTRAMILTSTTHPDVMLLDEKQRAMITKKYKELRSAVDIAASKAECDFESVLEIYASSAANEKIGTCSDFCLLMWKKLNAIGIQCELFQTEADHIILVIGRDIGNSDSNDFTTWRNAIVCDPWAGDIYPSSKIPTRLYDFSKYPYDEDYYVIVYPFNLKYQTLAPFFSTEDISDINEPPSKKSKLG